MSATRILVSLCMAAFVGAAVLGGAWTRTSADQPEIATKPATTPGAATTGTATFKTTIIFPGNQPVSPEDEQEALEYLKTHHPEYVQDLLKLKDAYPQKYQSNVRSIRFWIHSVTQFPDAIRDAYILQQQCYTRLSNLAQELRQVNDEIGQLQERMGKAAGEADQKQMADLQASQQELKARIHQAIDDRFDPDQLIREYRLEQLQKQISGMMDDIRKRDKQRSQLVDNELNMYVGECAKPQPVGAGATPTPATKPAQPK